MRYDPKAYGQAPSVLSQDERVGETRRLTLTDPSRDLRKTCRAVEPSSNAIPSLTEGLDRDREPPSATPEQALPNSTIRNHR